MDISFARESYAMQFTDVTGKRLSQMSGADDVERNMRINRFSLYLHKAPMTHTRPISERNRFYESWM